MLVLLCTCLILTLEETPAFPENCSARAEDKEQLLLAFCMISCSSPPRSSLCRWFDSYSSALCIFCKLQLETSSSQQALSFEGTPPCSPLKMCNPSPCLSMPGEAGAAGLDPPHCLQINTT